MLILINIIISKNIPNHQQGADKLSLDILLSLMPFPSALRYVLHHGEKSMALADWNMESDHFYESEVCGTA